MVIYIDNLGITIAGLPPHEVIRLGECWGPFYLVNADPTESGGQWE